MFTSYVSLSPLKSRKSEDLIQALTATILNQFKIPEIDSCDNKNGIANRAEFTKFFKKLGTRFEPTSTASPWSNGEAERAVQTSLQKFIMQELIQEIGIQNFTTSMKHIMHQHLYMVFDQINYILVSTYQDN